MSDWQDISTAPKNGTRIIVFPVRHHNLAAKCYEHHAVIAYWYHGSWIGLRAQNASHLLTNWMPLPEPPTQSNTPSDHEIAGQAKS